MISLFWFFAMKRLYRHAHKTAWMLLYIRSTDVLHRDGSSGWFGFLFAGKHCVLDVLYPTYRTNAFFDTLFAVLPFFGLSP